MTPRQTNMERRCAKLAPKWVMMASFWTRRGPSWAPRGILWALWGSLGLFLGPSRLFLNPFGLFLADRKIKKITTCCQSVFRLILCRFFQHLGANVVPKWVQVGSMVTLNPAFLAPSRPLLGRSWLVLAGSWVLLGRSWPLLRCFWPILIALGLLVAFGPLLGFC